MQKIFLAMAFSVVLSGCGGGGDESQVTGFGVASDEVTKASAGVLGATLVAQQVKHVDIPAGYGNFKSISPLPDGGYAVVRTADTEGPARFNIQRYDGSGNKTGEINLTDPAFAPDSKLTVLSNGDLLVSYTANRPFGPQSERAPLTKSAVYIQRFNSDGLQREQEGEIVSRVQRLRDQRAFNLFADARATALSDGGFVLGWDDRLVAVLGSESTFYIQRFNKDFERVGDSVKIDGTRPAYRIQDDSVGGFLLSTEVAAFSGGSGCAGAMSEPRSITVIHYDKDQAVTPIAGPASCISVLPLEENRYMLIGTTNDGPYNQLLDRRGRPIGAQIPIAARIEFKAPSLTVFVGQIVLADGSYVLFWRPNASTINGQRYSATGSALGEQLAIDARIAGVEQFVPLAGGGFVVAWPDFTQAFTEAPRGNDAAMRLQRKACRESAKSFQGQERRQRLDACLA